MALVVKNLPANAGDARDAGLIPGWEDPLEEEIATHSSILVWEIPWAGEPGGLQPIPWSHKELNVTEVIKHTLLVDVHDILLAPPDRLSTFFYSVLYPERTLTLLWIATLLNCLLLVFWMCHKLFSEIMTDIKNNLKSALFILRNPQILVCYY